MVITGHSFVIKINLNIHDHFEMFNAIYSVKLPLHNCVIYAYIGFLWPGHICSCIMLLYKVTVKLKNNFLVYASQTDLVSPDTLNLNV